MTAFFVPGAEPGDAEARYAELVGWAGADAAAPAERVLTLVFGLGAEEWTATVGQRPTGRLAARTDRRTVRRGPAGRAAPTREVTDTATVLAVVARGEGYLVVTDGRPLGGVDDSTLDNPTVVARRDVRRVVRFGT